MLYTKPCYNEPCYKEVVVYMSRSKAFPTRLHVSPAKTDQTAQMPRLTSVFAVYLKTLDPWQSTECTAKTDQTVYEQVDLSLCWVHMQSCRKCCSPAYIISELVHTMEPCSHISYMSFTVTDTKKRKPQIFHTTISL